MWAKYEKDTGIVNSVSDEEPELTEKEKELYDLAEVGPNAKRGLRLYECGSPDQEETPHPHPGRGVVSG